MFAYFNRFQIEMTKAEAESISHSGDCSADVDNLLSLRKIKRQLSKISNEDLKAELSEYGAWDDEELSDRQDNEQRIIWLAGGNIIDDINSK